MLKSGSFVRHVTSRHMIHNLFENTNNRTPSSTTYYHGGIFTVFTQYRFESLWAYGIQYERNLSDRVGHASLVRIWMFKSIIMCLFQMRYLKVFYNYYRFFTNFLPKALYGIKRSFVWLNIGLRVFGRT